MTLIVLLVLLVVLALAAFNFRSYIKAFIISQTKTSEELKQMLEDKKSPDKLLENYEGITIRDLTPEEKEKLANNELTEQEAIELIVGKSEDELLNATDNKQDNGFSTDIFDIPSPPDAYEDIGETPDETDVTDQPADPYNSEQKTDAPQKNENTDGGVTDSGDIHPESEPEAPAQDDKIKEANEKIARLVAQLYVTKSQSNTRLEKMESEWKAEYLKVPSKERKETNLLATYVKRAVKIVAQWESETDAQVEEILKEIKALLAESGQDQSLVGSLKTAYEDEKTYTKAYYMGKINKWI